MPKSSSKKPVVDPIDPPMQTATKTKVSTRTVAIVALASIAFLGLAAYGFGYWYQLTYQEPVARTPPQELFPPGPTGSPAGPYLGACDKLEVQTLYTNSQIAAKPNQVIARFDIKNPNSSSSNCGATIKQINITTYSKNPAYEGRVLKQWPVTFQDFNGNTINSLDLSFPAGVWVNIPNLVLPPGISNEIKVVLDASGGKFGQDFQIEINADGIEWTDTNNTNSKQLSPMNAVTATPAIIQISGFPCGDLTVEPAYLADNLKAEPSQMLSSFVVKNPNSGTSSCAAMVDMINLNFISNIIAQTRKAVLRKQSGEELFNDLIFVPGNPQLFPKNLIIQPGGQETLELLVDLSQSGNQQTVQVNIPVNGISWLDVNNTNTTQLSPTGAFTGKQLVILAPSCSDLLLYSETSSPPSFLPGAPYARLLTFALQNTNSSSACLAEPFEMAFKLTAESSPPRQLVVRQVGASVFVSKQTPTFSGWVFVAVDIPTGYFSIPAGQTVAFEVFLDTLGTSPGDSFGISLSNDSIKWKDKGGFYYPSAKTSPSTLSEGLTASIPPCENAVTVEPISIAIATKTTLKSQLKSWPLIEFNVKNTDPNCQVKLDSFYLNLYPLCKKCNGGIFDVADIKLVQYDNTDPFFKPLNNKIINSFDSSLNPIVNFTNVILGPNQSRKFRITADITNGVEGALDNHLNANVPGYIIGFDALGNGFHGGLKYQDQYNAQHYYSKVIPGYFGTLPLLP